MRQIGQKSNTLVAVSLLAIALSGCSSRLSLPKSEPGDQAPTGPAVDLSRISDPVPRLEPRSRTGNSPYTVFGVRYTPMSEGRGYSEQGIASWYGTKFHGRKTSSGEPYDMYQMTAAHKTLPIPSYVRVDNLDNGRSIVVRVNDRGPFSNDRLIDLSYVAALKLDVVTNGTGRVQVTAIDPANSIQAGSTGSAIIGQPAVVGTTNMSPSIDLQPVQGTAGAAGVSALPPVQQSGQQQSVTLAAPAMQQGQTGAVVQGTPTPAGGLIFVQIAAFGDINNAMRMQTDLQQAGFGPVIVMPTRRNNKVLYRVRIGPLPDVAVANAELTRVYGAVAQNGLTAATTPRVVVE